MLLIWFVIDNIMCINIRTHTIVMLIHSNIIMIEMSSHVSRLNDFLVI